MRHLLPLNSSVFQIPAQGDVPGHDEILQEHEDQSWSLSQACMGEFREWVDCQSKISIDDRRFACSIIQRWARLCVELN